MNYNQVFDCLHQLPATADSFPDYPERFDVPESKRDWKNAFPEYQPPYYTSERILKMTREGRADPEDISQIDFHDPKKYYSLHQGGLDDESRIYVDPKKPLNCHGFKLDEKGYPLNPLGRTGLRGRGACKHWGPIQAADALLTRLNPKTNAFEVLVVERADNGQTAFPGGKLDPGEFHRTAALRELFEEAIQLPANLTDGQMPFHFSNDETVFEGVMSDPRNTDNAWYESRVFHKHLSPELANLQILRASSDATRVSWERITPDLINNMFAGHGQILDYTLHRLMEEEKKIRTISTEQRQEIRRQIKLVFAAISGVVQASAATIVEQDKSTSAA